MRMLLRWGGPAPPAARQARGLLASLPHAHAVPNWPSLLQTHARATTLPMRWVALPSCGYQATALLHCASWGRLNWLVGPMQTALYGHMHMHGGVPCMHSQPRGGDATLWPAHAQFTGWCCRLAPFRCLHNLLLFLLPPTPSHTQTPHHALQYSNRRWCCGGERAHGALRRGWCLSCTHLPAFAALSLAVPCPALHVRLTLPCSHLSMIQPAPPLLTLPSLALASAHVHPHPRPLQTRLLPF